MTASMCCADHEFEVIRDALMDDSQVFVAARTTRIDARRSDSIFSTFCFMFCKSKNNLR